MGSAAFLRGIGRLGLWLEEAGLVAHFDEDYEAAQLLLSTWKYLHRAPEPTPKPTTKPSWAPGLRTHADPQLPATILDRARLLTTRLESLHSLGVLE